MRQFGNLVKAVIPSQQAPASMAPTSTAGFVVKPNVDSPSGSGLKSVVSGPLDELGSFDKVWAALVDVLQNPVAQWAVKESQLLPGATESLFSVKQVLDGRVLRGMGQGKGTDDQERTLVYKLNKAQGTIAVETHGVAGRVRGRNWAVVHKTPLFLEWWGEAVGTRKSGTGKAQNLQTLLDSVLKKIGSGGKAEVSPNTNSLSGNGQKSVVSAPLDKFVDFDQLYLGLVSECKQNGQVSAATPNTFKLAVQEGDKTLTKQISLDKASGEIATEIYGPKGRLGERTWVVIKKKPLQVEFWGETAGERKAGGLLSSWVQASILDPVVAKLRKPAAGSRARILPNQPSIAMRGSGQLSVVSEPLSKLTTFDKLWDAWVAHLKAPSQQDFVKAVEVLPVSDTEFKVVRTLDEEGLVASGRAKKVREDEQFFSKYILDNSKGIIINEQFGKAGRVKDRNTAVLHRKPLRLEWWGETPGERKSGALKQTVLQGLVDAIMARHAPNNKVKVNSGVPSPSGTGLKSVVSEPLDKFLTYDKLFAELMSLFKKPAAQGGVTYGAATGSDDSFSIVQTTNKMSVTFRYYITKSTGEIYRETIGSGGRIGDRNWCVVHKSPLQLEWWGEAPGEHKGGPVKSEYVQRLLDAVLKVKPGTAGPIKAKELTASPSGTGILNVVSDPMDKVTDYDKFWAAMVAWLKKPSTMPGFRSSDIVQSDGDRLFTLQRTEAPPPLKSSSSYSLSKEHTKDMGKIHGQHFSMDGRLQYRSNVIIHKDPLVVEQWNVAGITRKYGPARRNPMQAMVNALVKRAKPQAKPGAVQVSSVNKSRSVMSGPLVQVGNADKVFNELLELSRNPPASPMVQSSKLTQQGPGAFTVAQTLFIPAAKGKAKAKAKAKAKGAGKGGFATKTQTMKYKVFRGRGEIQKEIYGPNGQVTEKIFFMVRRGPPRLESWSETPGERRFGRDLASAMQDTLDAVLT